MPPSTDDLVTADRVPRGACSAGAKTEDSVILKEVGLARGAASVAKTEESVILDDVGGRDAGATGPVPTVRQKEGSQPNRSPAGRRLADGAHRCRPRWTSRCKRHGGSKTLDLRTRGRRARRGQGGHAATGDAHAFVVGRRLFDLIVWKE